MKDFGRIDKKWRPRAMTRTLVFLLLCLLAEASFIFSQGGEIPPEILNPAPQQYLLDVSERSLREWVGKGREIPVPEGGPAVLDSPGGVFVTLEKNGKLRGCRGTLHPRWESLKRETIHNTILAGSRDPRCAPVRASDLSSLTITLTIVGSAEPAAGIDDLASFEPALYGIVVTSDSKSAVMLPGEATGWPNMLKWARKRAGIGDGEPFELYRFKGIRFSRSLSRESLGTKNAPHLPLLTVGMRVPDFTLPDLQGRPVSVAALDGHVALLNFWAFWCDTWKEEVEKFKTLRSSRRDMPFRIMSVSIDGLRKEKGLEAIHAGKIDFPVACDEGGAISKARFGIREVPTLFVLDRERTVRFKHCGYPGNDVLTREIRQLSAEGGVKDGGRLALTFDDFPHPATAPRILDILKKYNAKATFFTLGARARKYPHLVKRAAREGHTLGNHSYSHLAPAAAGVQAIIEDFRKSQAVIEEVSGASVVLARAPGGSRIQSVVEAFDTLGLIAVPWDIDSGDIFRPGPERIADLVLSRARDGRIVLFHDGVEDTLSALSFIIHELLRRGFALVPADGVKSGAEIPVLSTVDRGRIRPRAVRISR
jgi:peptidoglycan/xylan/chitin deacetylase (PgdA/CDA1 family)/AMMECR1 domain-containing protein